MSNMEVYKNAEKNGVKTTCLQAGDRRMSLVDNRENTAVQAKLIKGIRAVSSIIQRSGQHLSTYKTDKFIQRKATIRPNSSLEVKRTLNTIRGRRTITVSANPDFQSNWGFIQDLKGNNKEERSSNCQNHTEPILINTFYDSAKEDWASANSLVEKNGNNPRFYLFTERKPCRECDKNLNHAIYKPESEVEYCDGIHNTDDIMDKYEKQAVDTVVASYPNCDFSKKQVERETEEYSRVFIISGFSKKDENIREVNNKKQSKIESQSKLNPFYVLNDEQSDQEDENNTIHDSEEQIGEENQEIVDEESHKLP